MFECVGFAAQVVRVLAKIEPSRPVMRELIGEFASPRSLSPKLTNAFC
jgi:hypothetical protein